MPENNLNFSELIPGNLSVKEEPEKKQATKIKPLTFKEVLDVLGCSERTLKGWRSKDKTLPVMKVKGRLHYDALKLLDWLIITSREDMAAKLCGWLDKKGVEIVAKKKGRPRKKQAQKKSNKEILNVNPSENKKTPGAFKFSFRFDKNKPVDIFEVKKMTGALLKAMTAEMDGADYTTVAINSKTLATIAEGYRKIEASCIEIDEQLKNVIPLSAVEKFHGEILTRVKTDIRALPSAIADRVASMKSPEKISALMKKEIDDCLRHLSEEINADAILSK